MKIENKKANINKLKEYGFLEDNGFYIFYQNILNGEFKLKISIEKSNIITTELREISTNEIYTLHLLENPQGSFIGQIKEEYEKIISNIISNCFETDIFKSEYTKKVIQYLKEKYNVELEYLWEKFTDNAVFRRKDNKKWFGVILTIPKNKLGFKTTESVEIIDLKAVPEEILKIVDNKKYFKGYHMNKKYWLTIILDNSVDIEEIYKRIDESYTLATK